uniref:Rho GTPase activating protein 28 n=1 Tax=Amphiprion percula TaxID=161767 RepID=A0A3P8RKG9_AMPPE
MLSSSSTTSSTLPSHDTVTSDRRCVAMETYWREVHSIEEEKEGEEEEEERKSMDEVELEEAWLTEAGLSSLVTGSVAAEETLPPAEVLLSTLTRQQVTTVRRRLDNYNETLKKRNRQPIRDVRDVFTEVGHNIYTARMQHIYNMYTTYTQHAYNTYTCIQHIYNMYTTYIQHVYNFVPVSPSEGLTCADDLSSCDLTRLGFISHIEVSTFLLALDSGVFGVPLNSLLENDKKKFPGVKVPVVFQKLLCILEQTGLQTEGILRVPGSAARLKVGHRCSGAFDWSAVRQVDAAGLLKLFIRELPTPLLTHTHLSTYRSLLGNTSLTGHLFVQALQLLSLLLPEVHRDTLRALLVFLRKVVFHQDQNRMSVWNVSMVMAPNLFTCCHRGNKSSIAKQQEEMEEAVGAARLIRLMITHQDLLWTVPTFLLLQVRHMNQVSNQKQLGLSRTTRRLLRRRNDRNQHQLPWRPSSSASLCEGVIRVQAPRHTKVSMAIQLDEQMTARDVTSRFECEDTPVQHLYEVGGNICESHYDIIITLIPAGHSDKLTPVCLSLCLSVSLPACLSLCLPVSLLVCLSACLSPR